VRGEPWWTKVVLVFVKLVIEMKIELLLHLAARHLILVEGSRIM